MQNANIKKETKETVKKQPIKKAEKTKHINKLSITQESQNFIDFIVVKFLAKSKQRTWKIKLAEPRSIGVFARCFMSVKHITFRVAV